VKDSKTRGISPGLPQLPSTRIPHVQIDPLDIAAALVNNSISCKTRGWLWLLKCIFVASHLVGVPVVSSLYNTWSVESDVSLLVMKRRAFIFINILDTRTELDDLILGLRHLCDGTALPFLVLGQPLTALGRKCKASRHLHLAIYSTAFSLVG
jgi:hypothetical protein